MITYPIGALAERIVAVTIDRAGMIKSALRHRNADGSLGLHAEQDRGHAAAGTAVEFVVRVESGHSGVVEIRPATGASAFARTIIPLGADRPFLESELPPSPGANGAFSQSESIKFHFAAPTLTWSTENMSGRVELTEHTPSVAVTLRLPAGNDGEIIFPVTVGRRVCTSATA